MYNTRKLESEGVHGLLEGFNRNSRPQAAVANNNHLAQKFSGGQVYYTSLIILSKSGPNRSSSSRENVKKPKFFRHPETYSRPNYIFVVSPLEYCYLVLLLLIQSTMPFILSIIYYQG